MIVRLEYVQIAALQKEMSDVSKLQSRYFRVEDGWCGYSNFGKLIFIKILSFF